MSPVRGSGWYKRPWHLRWFDAFTGKWNHAEFHWDGPARERRDEMERLPNRFQNVTLTKVEP